MRGLHADTIAALAVDHERAHLITFGFDAPARLTDYGTDLVHDSNTYNATGHVKGVDSLRETGELRVNSSRLTLDGADQTYISLFLNNDYMGISVDIVAAILLNGVIQGDPISVFSGQITGVDIEDSGRDSSLSITMANHWSDWKKKNGFRTNIGSHQRVFSGDMFFEFSTEQDREIVWGRR